MLLILKEGQCSKRNNQETITKCAYTASEYYPYIVELELEVGLIQTQLAQTPALKAVVHVTGRFRCKQQSFHSFQLVLQLEIHV